MKKQIIRLTESDLHNIIKESVNNILTELDWRTLSNAEDKAMSKALNAQSAPEMKLAHMQANNFRNAKLKKQQDMYDGVDSVIYDKEHAYPKSKTVFDDGEKRFFSDREFGKERTSLRKQLGGASKIAQFNRGEDEYRDGKWQKKMQ